ncbi:MAG TPA: helix-turn-helix transcriptional regulator [Steroidobacteraceae bacterium]|nr:helix-turn-helix transcriptional regulator [Steroidobacteraceae bacterium]
MTALTTFGQLLRAWRDNKRVSQQELSFRSGLSSKHISFLETGRAQPSKESILAMSTALDIPLREVNVLFASAGLNAQYRESPPDAPALESVKKAIVRILEKHLPYPAWVVNGEFDVIMLNDAALAINKMIVAELPDFSSVDPMFHPQGLRRCIANWEDVATLMLRRMQREILLGKKPLQKTFDRVNKYPGIPSNWRSHPPALSSEPAIQLELILCGQHLSFLTALTTFGSAVDAYVQELTIESCFPNDTATERFCRDLPVNHVALFSGTQSSTPPLPLSGSKR